jgi:hypothetical protein
VQPARAWSDGGRKPTLVGHPMIPTDEVLRRLTIGDRAFCQRLMATPPDEQLPALDPRSAALVRLSGSIAAGTAAPLLYQRVEDARAAGLQFDDLVAVLPTLAPILGIDGLVAVAPDLARALGYDIDAALEAPV